MHIGELGDTLRTGALSNLLLHRGHRHPILDGNAEVVGCGSPRDRSFRLHTVGKLLIIIGGVPLSIHGRLRAISTSDLWPKTAGINNILYAITFVLDAQRVVDYLISGGLTVSLRVALIDGKGCDHALVLGHWRIRGTPTSKWVHSVQRLIIEVAVVFALSPAWDLSPPLATTELGLDLFPGRLILDQVVPCYIMLSFIGCENTIRKHTDLNKDAIGWVLVFAVPLGVHLPLPWGLVAHLFVRYLPGWEDHRLVLMSVLLVGPGLRKIHWMLLLFVCGRRYDVLWFLVVFCHLLIRFCLKALYQLLLVHFKPCEAIFVLHRDELRVWLRSIHFILL